MPATSTGIVCCDRCPPAGSCYRNQSPNVDDSGSASSCEGVPPPTPGESLRQGHRSPLGDLGGHETHGTTRGSLAWNKLGGSGISLAVSRPRAGDATRRTLLESALVGERVHPEFLA